MELQQTDSMGKTSIQVTDELADELYSRKGRGETYEDVIWRLIDDEDNRDTHARDPAPAEPAADRERLAELLSGQGDLLDRRVDAILSMRDRLRERGSATKHELLESVDPEVVEYADSESVWANMAKGVFGELPGVESPPPGKSEWRWVGEV